MVAMALSDYLPWNRREFATVGRDPPFKKDEPRSFGAGVIKRIKINKNFGTRDFEPQIGNNRRYMEIFLTHWLEL